MIRVSKKKLYIGICSLCLLLLIFPVAYYLFSVLGWDGLTTMSSRELWRNRIKSFFQDIELDLNQQQVLKIAKTNGWDNPNACVVSSNEIRLGTPLELGASNWIVILKFKNDKLISAIVRIEDDINSQYEVKGAPKDIIFKEE